MSVVTLVSGGLDSTLMAALIDEESIEQYPLFVDYGQRARRREFAACQKLMKRHRLPLPEVANLRGYGKLIPSGLTSTRLRVFEDAFLPCRNLMFLTIAAAHAYRKNAGAVAIGLLKDSVALFGDQTQSFCKSTEEVLTCALGRPVSVLTPLIEFTKSDVVRIASRRGIRGTYSCHMGREKPCLQCVSCREYPMKEGD